MQEKPLIDFYRSYLSWITEREKSIGKISIESVCSTIDSTGKNVESVCLSAPLMAGNVYAEKDLAKQPPYWFQIAANEKIYQIFRDYKKWESNDDTFDTVRSLFDELTVHLRTTKGMYLDSVAEICSFRSKEENINAKVGFSIGGYRYNCEFPVKHINYHVDHKRFQVETGPILVPCMTLQQDENSKVGNAPFQTAYIFFNTLKKAEFLLKEAPPLGTGEPRFYSKVVKLDVNIQVLSTVTG